MKSRQVGIACIAAVLGMLTTGCADSGSQSGTAHAQTAVADASDSAGSELPGVASDDRLRILVSQALQDDRRIADIAFLELRNLGQAAVDYLMSRGAPANVPGEANMRASQPSGQPPVAPRLEDEPKLVALLDAVAQQKDAKYCGLFWYTDLDQALAAAKRERKPVLSLRLLGKLTDELSCANSRFFRTTLYPNSQVKDLLRNQFVLHWQSVRAVPIITIDFQDGRKIERTITGNSLHLVLDDQGRPVDVLPGLYAAEMFIQVLKKAGPAAVELGMTGENQFRQERAQYHGDRLVEMERTWRTCCQQALLPDSLPIGVNHSTDVWNKVGGATVPFPPPAPDKDVYRAIAEHVAAVGKAEAAGLLAAGKGGIESPMIRLVRNFGTLLREDSFRNEYYCHAQIHKWFMTSAQATTSTAPSDWVRSNSGNMARGGFGEGQSGGSARPVTLSERHMERDQLVNRIYSELFLSPLDDPWYGLSRPDVYSAIKNDGRIDAVTQNTGH